MSILQKLREQSLERRKRRSQHAIFLTSVLSDATILAKSETKLGITPEVDDDHALRAIRSSIKQQEEVLTLVTKDTVASQNAIEKKQLLVSLLPDQPTEEEIQLSATEFLKSNNLSGRSAIGSTMKYLVEQYGATLDKRVASNIIQQIISII